MDKDEFVKQTKEGYKTAKREGKRIANTEVRTGRAVASFLFPGVGLYTYVKLRKTQPDKADTYGLLNLVSLGLWTVAIIQNKLSK